MTAAFLAGAAAGAALSWLWFSRRRRRDARYLSFVAHELNTPLTALHLTAVNLADGVFGTVSPEHEPWLALLREQAVRLAAVLGDLRDYVHMEFHKDLRLESGPCDAAALLLETLESMEGTWTRSGVTVDHGAVPRGLPVLADKERLRRVLSGVLWHVRKFHSNGPVVLGGSAAPAALSFDFTTKALTPREARAMLELYHPVRRRAAAVLPGVGLGLGFSRRLAERMGGALDFSVEDGGAARIRLSLPPPAGGAK